MKREHSRKPDEIIPIIEACSQGLRIELFARGIREGWDMWGNQATEDYEPTWGTYSNHTVAQAKQLLKERRNIYIFPVQNCIEWSLSLRV